MQMGPDLCFSWEVSFFMQIQQDHTPALVTYIASRSVKALGWCYFPLFDSKDKINASKSGSKARSRKDRGGAVIPNCSMSSSW
jgi:hypothetical protein